MPLKKPSRLPRNLNRPTSKYTRQVVERRHKREKRSKKKQIQNYIARRWTKIGRFILDECKFWLIIFSLTAVTLAVIVLLFSSVLDVKQMRILRQDARIDIEEIEQALAPLFNQRLFLVTKTQVTNLLEPQFPDITEISIEKDYPSTLTVALHLDRLVAELDIQQPESLPPTESGAVMTGSGGHVYITSRGYVVLSTIRLSDAPLPIFTLLDWGIRPTHSSRILDENFILRVFEARDTLQENFGLPVSNTAIYLRAREFHLQSNGISFWFDLSSSLQSHFDRFRNFLQAFSLDDVNQYIDLRLSDKVVWQ